jgi:hypothetical protein
VSWLSEAISKFRGKEKSVAAAPAASEPFKAGWPKRFVMADVEFETDMTQSHPAAKLAELLAKKTAKGFSKMWDEPIAGMPGHVRVYWIRPVVVKPAAGSDTVAPTP